ncbi:MAG: diguanylate cyclase [Acidimicrobiales bacterium]
MSIEVMARGELKSEAVQALMDRATSASSPSERASCLHDIGAALEAAEGPIEKAELYLCLARVHSNQWKTAEVLDDALSAMKLFEESGDVDGVLNAASLGAAFASRLGRLSLATELATKVILGVGSVKDDCLLAELANRLGIFCYSFLDYDRAVEQMELSLAAAERCGDLYMTCRQLHNIADALLLAVRVNRKFVPASAEAFSEVDRKRLERAGQVIARLLAEAPEELLGKLGGHRLQAELLLESGHPEEALEVVNVAKALAAVVPNPQRAALAVVESRCLRVLGRARDAVAAAERAVSLAVSSGDDHELMLTLEERLGAKQAAGYLEGAIADALEVKWRMLAIHQRQTAQVVESTWQRAALEQQRRQLEATAAAAMRSAEEDTLSGIGNRRLLERFLGSVACAEPPVELTLVVVDIDHFKVINDTFGHELGDLVIRAMGALLEAEVRAGQVVGRYGGDEFVFVMPGVELAAAARFAERARARVEAYPWRQLERSLAVTISLGVASGSARTWRSVLGAADEALYLAKGRGRNRVEAATAVAEAAG